MIFSQNIWKSKEKTVSLHQKTVAYNNHCHTKIFYKLILPMQLHNMSIPTLYQVYTNSMVAHGHLRDSSWASQGYL